MGRWARHRRAAAALLALAFGAAVVGACGDDGEGDASTATPASTAASSMQATVGDDEDVDPDGILRIGLPGTTLDLWSTFDLPNLPAVPRDTHRAVFDSLLRQQADGTLVSGLAREVTIVDPSTVKVELQPDVRFSDGTPLDAAAVKAGMERNINARNTRTFGAELQEVAGITVDGPLALTISLKKPIAGYFKLLLSRGEGMVQSPTAVSTGVDLRSNPSGAGPFLLDRVEPTMVRLVRNPDYFEADRVRIAAVEYTLIPPDPGGIITALRSGAVDVVDVPQPTTELIEGLGDDFEVRAEMTENVTLWGQMWKDKPPFNDVRVRQALNFGIDRDAINQALFDGRSEPQWGMVSSKSPYFDPDLEGLYAYDPERARALLEEADVPDLTFAAYYSPGLSQRFGEILQDQWSRIGVTLQLQPFLAFQDFFIDGKAPLFLIPLYLNPIDKVTRVLQPGGIGNVGGWNDPEMNALVDRILAEEPGSMDVVDEWHQVSRLTLEKAANIFGVFGQHVNVWNADVVGDMTFVQELDARPIVDPTSVYIKRK